MSTAAAQLPEPVVPRPAATVLLLRDVAEPEPGRGPLQVFLQRRVAAMAFAGGMTVFPGGGVDISDRPAPERWSGPDPRWWGEHLGCPAELAGALVHAAVRETFEECGVLLAGSPDGSVVDSGGDAAAGLAAGRGEVVAGTRSFADLIAATGLVVRADLLHAWTRWVTPAGRPQRYDTVFFTAIVPDGQEADAATSEAVEASWWYPGEALDRHRDGEIGLMRPTLSVLQEIAGFPDAASLHAAAAERRIVTITPQVHRIGDRTVVLLPGDAGYDDTVDRPEPGARP